MGNEKSKVSKGMAMAIIMTSLLFDGIQFLVSFLNVAFGLGLVINRIIDFCIAYPVFILWFKILGVSFFNGKKSKLFALLSDFVIGFIPFVDSFGWTIDVGLIIAAVWAEENSLLKKVSSVTKIPGATRYLNRLDPAGQLGTQLQDVRKNPKSDSEFLRIQNQPNKLVLQDPRSRPPERVGYKAPRIGYTPEDEQREVA